MGAKIGWWYLRVWARQSNPGTASLRCRGGIGRRDGATGNPERVVQATAEASRRDPKNQNQACSKAHARQGFSSGRRCRRSRAGPILQVVTRFSSTPSLGVETRTTSPTLWVKPRARLDRGPGWARTGSPGTEHKAVGIMVLADGLGVTSSEGSRLISAMVLLPSSR